MTTKPILLMVTLLMAAGAQAQSSGTTTAQNGSSNSNAMSNSMSNGVTNWNYDNPSSMEIRRIQNALNANGASINEDGVMGPQTQSALRTLQTNRNMSVTGRLNPETIDALSLSAPANRAPASTPTNSVPPTSVQPGTPPMTHDHRYQDPMNRPTGPANPGGTMNPSPTTPATPGNGNVPNGATTPAPTGM